MMKLLERKRKLASSLAEFLIRRKYLLMALAFIAFAAYRVSKHVVFDGIPSLQYTSSIYFNPLSVSFFVISVIVFLIAYKFAPRLPERRMLAVLFLVALLMMLSMNSFTVMGSPASWSDAETYYNLGVVGAEAGQLTLIRDYNTIGYQVFERGYNSTFDSMREYSVNPFFKPTYGLVGIAKDFVLSFTSRSFFESPTVYDISLFPAARVNPPLWPLILSLFIVLLGTGHYSVLIAEWLICALVPVALYFWIKRFTDGKTAMKVAFMFIFVPSFLLWTTQPLIDAPLTLFVITAAYLYVTSIEKEKYGHAILSGIIFSLCFLLKFEPLLLYLPFFLLPLLKRDKLKRMSMFVTFFAASMAIPLLLLTLNYSLFLNVVMAKVAQEMTISSYVSANLFNTTVLPVYLLSYFGIPFIFLLCVGVVRLCSMKGFEFPERISIVFILTLVLMWFILFGSGLDRHMLPFLPLVLPLAANEIKSHKLDDRFVMISVIICVAQLLLFL